MTYFNTTGVNGQELREYRRKAVSQEDRILSWFINMAGYRLKKGYSPSQVADFCFDGDVPITSIRRAITSLTNEGHLVKTNKTVAGPYGRPESLWALAEKHLQGDLFHD